MFIEKVIYIERPDAEWQEGLYVAEYQNSDKYCVLSKNFEPVPYVYDIKPSAVNSFKLEFPGNVFNLNPDVNNMNNF